MKTLTATNQRVQFYLTYTTDRPNKALKRDRLNQLEERLNDRGVMLDELFPNKQADVLDHILYITSAAGISKIGAETLAERCGASVRTVTSAVKALKSTGEYIVGRLIKTKGGAGKYIFIDKKHPNFREIMREVFSLSDYKLADLLASLSAEQKSEKSHEAVGVESDNSSSNLNISFISKHEKHKYVGEDIEAIQKAIEENTEPSLEYVKEYATNKRQIAFYELLEAMPYPDRVKSVRHVLALRTGSDCNDKRFLEAKDAIHSIAMQILEGIEIDNVVAAFTGLLNKRMSYNVPKPNVPVNVRPVPFYDWLEERE